MMGDDVTDDTGVDTSVGASELIELVEQERGRDDSTAGVSENDEYC